MQTVIRIKCDPTTSTIHVVRYDAAGRELAILGSGFDGRVRTAVTQARNVRRARQHYRRMRGRPESSPDLA